MESVLSRWYSGQWAPSAEVWVTASKPKYLLRLQNNFTVCGEKDGMVRILDDSTANLLVYQQIHQGQITGLVSISHPLKFITCGIDGFVKFCELVPSKKEIKITTLFSDNGSPISSIASNDHSVVFGTQNGKIFFINLEKLTFDTDTLENLEESNENLFETFEFSQKCPSVVIHSIISNNFISCCDTTSCVYIWDLKTKELIINNQIESKKIVQMMFGGNSLSNQLFLGSDDGKIFSININNDLVKENPDTAILPNIFLDTKKTNLISFQIFSTSIATLTGLPHNKLQFWSLDPSKRFDDRILATRELDTWGNGLVMISHLTSNGRELLIIGCSQGMVTIWDVFSRINIYKLDGHHDPVISIVTDDWVVVSSGSDKTVRVWRFLDRYTIEDALQQEKAIKDMVNDLKEKGNNEMKASHYQNAIDFYSEAIKLDPSNPILYSNRALGYFRCKEYQRSIVDCKIALPLSQKEKNDLLSSKILCRHGKCLLAISKYQESIDCFTQSLQLDQTNNDSQNGKNDALQMIRFSEAQLLGYNAIKNKNGVLAFQSFENCLLIAKLIDKLSDINSDEKKIKIEKINIEEKNFSGYFNLEDKISIINGRVLSLCVLGGFLETNKSFRNNTPKSQIYFENALVDSTVCLDLVSNLGQEKFRIISSSCLKAKANALFGLKRWSEAVNYYQDAIKVGKEIDQEIAQNLVLLLEDRRSFLTEKESSAQEKIEQDRLHSLAEEEKRFGNECYTKKQFPEAIRFYTQAIRLFPTDPIYYSNRASVHLESGNFTACVSDCKMSLLKMGVKLKTKSSKNNNSIENNKVIADSDYKNRDLLVKVLLKAAKSYHSLEKYDSAYRACSRVRALDKDNKQLASIMQLLEKSIRGEFEKKNIEIIKEERANGDYSLQDKQWSNGVLFYSRSIQAIELLEKPMTLDQIKKKQKAPIKGVTLSELMDSNILGIVQKGQVIPGYDQITNVDSDDEEDDSQRKLVKIEGFKFSIRDHIEDVHMIYFGRAMCLCSLEKYEESLRDVDMAIARMEDDSDSFAILLKIRIFEKMGRHREAMEELVKAHKKKQNDTEILANLKTHLLANLFQDYQNNTNSQHDPRKIRNVFDDPQTKKLLAEKDVQDFLNKARVTDIRVLLQQVDESSPLIGKLSQLYLLGALLIG